LIKATREGFRASPYLLPSTVAKYTAYLTVFLQTIAVPSTVTKYTAYLTVFFQAIAVPSTVAN